MAGAGTVFVELDLDFSKFEKNQQKLLHSATTTSLSVERNWQNLGAKSDAIFQASRNSIINSYEMIKNRAGTTAAEMVRIEEAKNKKIEALNKEQFGAQESMLAKLKNSWAMKAAGIASAIYVIQQAHAQLMKVVALGELGAKIERTEAAFNSVAKAAGISAEETVRALKMASKGMMDESDIMVKASRLIQIGIPIATLTELMTLLAKQAPIVGDTLPEAWDKFGDALSRGKLKGVQNYVGMLDLDEALKKYATSIGRTVGELTDESRQMITAEIVTAKLRETTQGLADSQETASEKILKAKTAMNEAHEQMAKQWIPIATGYYNAMAKILEVWNRPSLWDRTPPKGRVGAGASGSWGPDISKFTMDNATATMTPVMLTFQKDEKAEKERAEAFKKGEDEYLESLKTYFEEDQKLLDQIAKMEADARIKSNEAEQRGVEQRIANEGIYLDEYLEILDRRDRAHAESVKVRFALEEKAREDDAISMGIAFEEELEERNKAAVAIAEDNKRIREEMKKGWQDVGDILSSSFEAGFFDLYKNGIKDLGSAWDSFCNNLVESFMRAMSKMATNALLFGNIEGKPGEGGLFGGVTGIVGFLGGLFGGIGGGGAAIEYGLTGHRGGDVTPWGIVPRFHSGLKPDEIPAILQTGERVLSRKEVAAGVGGGGVVVNIFAADAQSFNDMCRRNPGAILGPVIESLKRNGPMRPAVLEAL